MIGGSVAFIKDVGSRENIPENLITVMLMSDRFLIGNISVSYTLKTDDITKGVHPGGTPYVSRTGEFDENGYNADTMSELVIKKIDDGVSITLSTESEDLSEFGLNLPFNFMGKKNGGGWRNQYLFNSPYSSKDNKFIYCYFSNPEGRNLMLVFSSEADGWKMDYSPYLGGHYFYNFKALANFDKAYKTGSNRKKLELILYEVPTFEKGLEKVSEVYGVPVFYYDKNGGAIGDEIKIKAIGNCDEIEINGKNYEYCGEFGYKIDATGEISVVPYYKGKKGLDCSLYGYNDIDDLYERSMYSVTMEDIAATDGNLCEHQCYVSAMLRFMMRYGRSEKLEETVKRELDVICETDINKAIARQTILVVPHDRFPAYNVYKSGRIQEQFFGIIILLDAYKYFKDEKYLLYAEGALDSLISYHQNEKGGFETFVEWLNKIEDYTTVCAPMITIVDMAVFMKDKDPGKSEFYKKSAKRCAEYLYNRGLNFPTEGGFAEEAETEMEDGSISCTALSLLYYCAKIERVEKYIEKAKEILDIHESWVIKTPIAPMFCSSLRWWETLWEGDADGNALCCGHAWTIWRAEADYWYYYLTGDKEYLRKSLCGFISNFSKIDENGKSYTCYQPDYITGGGLNFRCEEVNFHIAKGFPKQSDSGLSRYAWIRYYEVFLCDKRLLK